MKTKFISLLLILSFLTSLFTVFTFASDASTVSDDTVGKVQEHLHYRNSFGDAGDDIGGNITLSNASLSSVVLSAETNGNKYGHFTFNDSKNNVFFQFTPLASYTIGTEQLGYMIYEMDFNDFGKAVTTNKFLEIHSGEGSFAPTGGRIAVTDVLNIANSGGKNYFYFNNNKSDYVTIPSNEWVHIRLELSILSESATTYNLKCYIQDKCFEKSYKLGSPAIIKHIRFGSTNSTNQSFGLDNITLYSAPENLPSYDEIGSINRALIMKVGAENAKNNGLLTELPNTPILIDNRIYCPVDVIESYASTSCPADYIVRFDDVEYIHIDDIYKAFGIYAKHYIMGLIIVTDDPENFIPEDSRYDAIMEIMKGFIFDIPSSDGLKEDVKTYTDNFDHPYLLADADKFAELRSVFERGNNNEITDPEELILYGYIKQYVNSAKNKLSSITGATPDGTYTGIIESQVPVNKNYLNYNNNGYDNGGRVNSIPSTNLFYFAFAYQMTGKLNYARAAYDYSLALGEWNHWGPSHFLNCADAAAPFAIAYDWLYDAYKELAATSELSKFDGETYSTEKLAEIIFSHAIIPGYIQSNALNCPWPGSVESRYATTQNNWNAVCTSGMVASALAIIGEDISAEGMTFITQTKSGGVFTNKVVSISEIGNPAIHMGLTTYSDYAAKLATMNMNSLMRYGLGEYAPDGSYVESPGYWSYGTNTYFRMVGVLLTATGDDYGFMDSWGMDTTCYFAIHSESSDYRQWSYNDGGDGSQNSSYFFFVGNYYGDDNLVRVRKKHLQTGKSYDLMDIIFYDTSITGEPTLATEYYMEGIDGYAVRSSWDKGALYAGIMGGPNSVSHGHMDGGTFVYHNKGKIWFHDLGSDQYNITYVNDKGQNKGYFSNYELYRIGAEGHNIITITSEQDTLPYGQATNAEPQIINYYSSSEGAYAIVDMSDSYGTHVTSAKRGMLFTDLRSTVVIQDEIVFNGEKTAYWFGHYNLAPGYVDEIILSYDKKTAFMISGDDIVRVSIVSDNADLSFEIMDAYTYLLDITHDTDRTAMNQPNTEYNRDSIRKLAIKCENVETLNLAVVIEEVKNYTIGCSYTWKNMADWNVDGAETLESEYKFKADYEDVGLHIGSVNKDLSDELSYDTIETEYGSYINISSVKKATTKALNNVDFTFKSNEPIKLLRYKYAVVDFDISTDSKFIPGTSIGFNTSNSFTPIVTLSENIITAGDKSIDADGWTKITVIIDSDSNIAYVYSDNEYLATLDNLFFDLSPIINSLSVQIPKNTVSDKKSNISLDNIFVRTLGTLYDEASLKTIITNKDSLTKWSDNLESTSISAPLAISDGTYIYDANTLQVAIDSALNITLLRDCPVEISVSTPISINTNGYALNFTTDNCILDIDGDYYRFEKGSIKVVWHIGSGTYSETYTSSKIATFKNSNSNVGKITEKRIDYPDGGTRFDYFTTGWSNVKDGTYLTDEEMIVSKDNCEFWLVNNKPLECLYVVVSNSGTITKGTSESTLRNELKASNSNQRVVLCSNVEIMNTSALALSTGGKNLYLNGYTLKHAQNDVHMFIFTKANADFNIYGPGNLVADSSRTMFTTDASNKTNSYGVKLYNVNISTNVQFADLRIGQHEFINCTFNHTPTTSKTFLTIWDRNGLSSVTGTINGSSSNSAPLEGSTSNLITVKFKNCIINAGNGGNSPMVSYTSGTYSEVYFTDTSVITKGAIIDASYSSTYNPEVKMVFDGSSAVIANSVSLKSDQIYTNLIFDDGVITNINLNSAYIPDGALMTNNYSYSHPYRVSSDYALVRWLALNGTILHEEYVSVGVTPILQNSLVIDHLRSLNSGSIKYAYNTSEIKDSSSVSISPVEVNGSLLMQGMNLSVDFALEIYINKSKLDNEVKSVVINGVSITNTAYTLATVNGISYYKYRITRINPANAAKIQTIVITLNNGETVEKSFSVVSYLESLLMTSSDVDENILAIKTLKYIKSAYEYAGNSESGDISTIKNILEAYSKYDVLYGSVDSQYTSTAPINNAISGASLYLSASARFRFKINSSYTGTVTIKYMGTETTYEIISGRCGSLDYIQLELSVAELMSDIIISTESTSITYNIKSYYTALNTNDMALANMLFCLNEYSYAAKAYIGK